MTVFLCGNSHLAALHKGYRQLGKADEKYKFVPLVGANQDNTSFSVLEHEGVRFTRENTFNMFHKATKMTHIGTDGHWGICLGDPTYSIYRGPQWQKCRPNIFPTDGKRPISLSMIDSISRYDQRYFQEFIMQLKMFGVKFFIIATPTSDVDFHDSDNEETRNVRLFLQLRARQKFEEWLAEQKIDFVGLPPDTLEREGGLKKEFRNQTRQNGKRDFNHANGAFGSRMIKQVNEYLSLSAGNLIA